MKTKSIRIALPLALLVSGIFSPASADVPHAFNAGDPARASEVNENFNALDTRINALESKGASTPEFSGYSLPFSQSGQPRNVILLAVHDGFSGDIVGYSARVRWIGNESISMNGTLALRQFFASYVDVGIDAGNVTFLENWLESPDTAQYRSWLVEYSRYDTVSLTRTIVDDTQRAVSSCGSGAVQVCVTQQLTSINNVLQSVSSTARARNILSSVAIGGGWTFTDASAEKSIDGRGRLRIRAHGIGLVFQQSGGNYNRVVYYRVNGVAGGQLTGTPFAQGAPLEGLFFSP